MISVFYRSEQTANVEVFSPSPRKPKLVVDAWLKEFPDKIEVKSFEPATIAQLCAVHDPDYVRGVLTCTEPNGFGTFDKAVANSLPYTSGSMLAAAKHALKHGIAISPTSGFHHATYYGGGGYCTFEGLMVTTVALLNEGLVNKVGICDLDMHYGNGTADIISKLNFKKEVMHFTAGSKYHNAFQASDFLARLPKIITNMKDHECDILLCQLGADPHIDDPLGGWLTTGQMYQRDLIVYETCREIGMPLVTNLAGGYQEPVNKVIQLHVNMMEACLEVFDPIDA